MILQCDQPSILYYAGGIGNSIDGMDKEAIKKAVSLGGLQLNYTQPEDPEFWRLYGTYVNTQNAPFTLELNKLRSQSDYSIKYFCENQVSKTSDFQSAQFSIPYNGGYLMKITLWSSKLLNYSQALELNCAMTQTFSTPSDRIYTEFSQLCGENELLMPQLQGQQMKIPFTKEEINGNYPYLYYVLPDESIASDATNIFIREVLSDLKVNQTILSKALRPLDYGTLVEIETEDVSSSSRPVLVKTQDFKIAMNKIQANFKLEELKGFIIVGIIEDHRSRTDDLPSAW